MFILINIFISLPYTKVFIFCLISLRYIFLVCVLILKNISRGAISKTTDGMFVKHILSKKLIILSLELLKVFLKVVVKTKHVEGKNNVNNYFYVVF
jgi:hypothetical protein